MRELLISVILEFFDHHCQHLGHRVVRALNLTIAIWVVRAGGIFSKPSKLLDGMKEL